MCKLLSKDLAIVQQVNGPEPAGFALCSQGLTPCLLFQKPMPAEVLQLVLGQLSNKDLCKIGLTCKALYRSSYYRNLARLLEYVHTVINSLLGRIFSYAKDIKRCQELAVKAIVPGAKSKTSLQLSYQQLAEAEQRGTRIRATRRRLLGDLTLVEWYMGFCHSVKTQLFFDEDQLHDIYRYNMVLGRDSQSSTLIVWLKDHAIL